MGSKKSLTYLISKYAILELIYTAVVLLIFYMALNVLINTELVYPANYADQNSENIKEAFLEDPSSVQDIPFYYEYQLLEDGKVIQNSIDKKYDDEVNEAKISGEYVDNRIIGSSILKSFQSGNKQLIIQYQISAIPASASVFRWIKNFESAYFILLLITWLLGFIILVRCSSKVLRNEINKISEANINIEKMNLDYQREDSEYTEISGVLDSIDSLAKNLKESLKNEWDMQMQQKEMVESITHDIRTPITLIKGNIELLEEDPNHLEERLEDIENGLERLESYIERLKDFSILLKGPKVMVTEDVLGEWTKFAISLGRIHGREIKILAKETSTIYLDKEAILIALQNVINNAIENSPKNSVIFINFFDQKEDFSIVVRDKGVGFDSTILSNVKQRFLSSKIYDQNNPHGLGLSIVHKIVRANNGTLVLQNYQANDSGAEVQMIFTKKVSEI